MATRAPAAAADGDKLPVAFAFKVEFMGLPDQGGPLQLAFQEVSGLGSQLDVEELAEGGENRFVHQLPGQPQARRLSLKRALVARKSPLLRWCAKVLEGGFAEPIKLASVKVQLLNENGQPLLVWWCRNAYPVHWEVDGFGSTKNEAAIETIELAYQTLGSPD
ncbi:phage tail protein [Roseateles sp. DAIF2]|uniref:phage tail protein n=1 Tax=Roseateles sp. DAIF2 TaxID=2714952 RepID=UPI0018A3228C|nr:phage tail protein [Roseateles sp. DAIF2]QPF73398.1 phage tail protein [Roseateles sp. DAIF2]